MRSQLSTGSERAQHQNVALKGYPRASEVPSMAGVKGMRASLPLTVPEDAGPKTNLLDLVDARSAPARFIRRAYDAIATDLGGEDHLSFAQRSLVLRAANLECLLATREARMLAGTLKDEAEFARTHVQVVGTLMSIYKTLGLRRVARDVTLKDVLRKANA